LYELVVKFAIKKVDLKTIFKAKVR